ncbi:hypothetical protein CTI12_AA048250 [Artemisia annua]|uniref:Uncharacterized protein n=1 Tax=Artemisia annua TaxID=35608 RepID=A0A2U1QC63_ARTAN|nr:hypothetical protein CTI12_AA048250 [Artemisia annua]
MLRKLPKPPPAPKLSQGPHYKFVHPPPPPPPCLPIHATYPSFRTKPPTNCDLPRPPPGRA